MSVYIRTTHRYTHTHTHSSSPRLTLPFTRVPFKGPMESSSINKGPGHHCTVPRLVSVQCLTTRPGYLWRYLRLPPSYRSYPYFRNTSSSFLPHWIRFSFFSPSMDRYHRVRSHQFCPSYQFFSLSIPTFPIWARLAAPSAAISPPLPTIQLRPRLHVRNAWSPGQPPLLTFLLTVFTDPISYLFLPPLDIILFAITLPPCLH